MKPPIRVPASPSAITARERYWQIALDIIALPAVALAPRRPLVINGQQIPLRYLPLRHRYWRNERAVEMPLAERMIRRYDPATVLEVGNVLGNVGIHGHTVVDKYE